MKRRPQPTLSAVQLRAALEVLGLTQTDAVQVLRVASRQRVNHWCTGKQPVPAYVASHVETLLRLSRKPDAHYLLREIEDGRTEI